MANTTSNENTGDCKQAVFFATGPLNSVAQQFIDVLKYCNTKGMPIINIFVEQSNDEEKLYKAINDMLDFLARETQKTAIVAASIKNLPGFIRLHDILNLIVDDNIEFHFARSKTRLFNK